MTDENIGGSPILVLPEDRELQIRLQLKLTEYQSRLDPYQAPELQQGDYFKATVLERLLRDGKVNTYNLSLELGHQIGKRLFDHEAYDKACGVINGYITDGGANLIGGTGLPVN